MVTSDFALYDHGSIFLLEPLTNGARHWLEKRVDSRAQHWGNAVCIELPTLRAIVDDILADGYDIT
jgi:hypothetical protein